MVYICTQGLNWEKTTHETNVIKVKRKKNAFHFFFWLLEKTFANKTTFLSSVLSR
jgi:hypothetical protein